MIKLVIKSRFLPLNVDSFFYFKLKTCGSVIYDVKTFIRSKSATLWRIVWMSENVRGPITDSRTRVDGCREVSPT